MFPIASAAAACADEDARLPLPVNRDQTCLYRAIFDELGAAGTVALRGESGFIDSSTRSAENKWRYYSKAEKVYAVCEEMKCQSNGLKGIKSDEKCFDPLILDEFIVKKRKRRSG